MSKRELVMHLSKRSLCAFFFILCFWLYFRFFQGNDVGIIVPLVSWIIYILSDSVVALVKWELNRMSGTKAGS